MKLTIALLLFSMLGCTTEVKEERVDGSVIVENGASVASIKKVTIDGHDYIVLIGTYKAAICPATKD